MAIEMIDIDTVGDLIERLKQEAIDLDESGCSCAADGVYAAIRVITDVFSMNDVIMDHTCVSLKQPDRDKRNIEKIYQALLSREIAYQYAIDHNIYAGGLELGYLDFYNNAIDIRKQFFNLPVCSECHGTGEVRPLAMVWECTKCYGTGRYCSDVGKLIRLQQDLIVNQMNLINKVSDVICELKISPKPSNDELTALAVERFYKDCKYFGD